MKGINLIKILISCPGDVNNELNSIKLIIDEINKSIGKQSSFAIHTLNWKSDTYTQIGDDAQEVINNQVEDEYDILLGIIWKKIGTPTKRDRSGTIEEINRALDLSKELLLYFNISAPDNLSMIDTSELEKVNAFKRELSDKGVLYKEYDSIRNFESLFRVNLINLISDRFLNTSLQDSSESTKVPKKNIKKDHDSKYSEIIDLISEVENKDNGTNELDLFEIFDEFNSNLSSGTTSLNTLTISLSDLTENLNKRTEEINKINIIKDDRLRMSKIRIVANHLSEELNEFNNRINDELPSFSTYLTNISLTYSKILLIFSSYDNDENVASMKESALNLRDSMKESVESVAGMLRVIITWPLVNSKFNNSKRETELTLKNLTKEMLNGLILFDAALEN